MVINSLTNSPIKAGESPFFSIHKTDFVPMNSRYRAKFTTERKVGATLLEYKDNVFAIDGSHMSTGLISSSSGQQDSLVSSFDKATPISWLNETDNKMYKGAPASYIHRIWPTAEVVGDKVYIIGGYDENGAIAENQSYDLSKIYPQLDPLEDVQKFADTPFPVFYMGSTVYNNEIYVFGGTLKDRTQSDKVQKYDPSTDIWTQLSPMPTSRNVDVVAYNEKIYAVGGYSSESGDYNYIDVYDIVSDAWETRIKMPVNLSAHRVAIYKDFIFMVEDNKSLINPYGIMAVSRNKCPNVKENDSNRFINWLLSEKGRIKISKFKAEGKKLFYVDK